MFAWFSFPKYILLRICSGVGSVTCCSIVPTLSTSMWVVNDEVRYVSGEFVTPAIVTRVGTGIGLIVESTICPDPADMLNVLVGVPCDKIDPVNIPVESLL